MAECQGFKTFGLPVKLAENRIFSIDLSGELGFCTTISRCIAGQKISEGYGSAQNTCVFDSQHFCANWITGKIISFSKYLVNGNLFAIASFIEPARSGQD
jgi:hypothetical protein